MKTVAKKAVKDAAVKASMSVEQAVEAVTGQKEAAATAPTFQAIVDAETFLKAHSCASTEETRYYLNGVHIEPVVNGEGAIMVSTDGYTAIVVRDKGGYVANGTAIIKPTPAFLKALDKPKLLSKHLKYDPSGYKVVINGDRMCLVSVLPKVTEPLDAAMRHYMFIAANEMTADVIAVQMEPARIDGKFPDWRRVLPIIHHQAPVGMVNAALVDRLAKALNRGTYKTGARGIRLLAGVTPGGSVYPPDKKSDGCPIFVKTDNRETDGFGIIMPMREGNPAQYPAWCPMETLEQRNERLAKEKAVREQAAEVQRRENLAHLKKVQAELNKQQSSRVRKKAPAKKPPAKPAKAKKPAPKKSRRK